VKSGVLLRRGFYLFVVLLFALSLFGMFVTGPVVVRVPRLPLESEPSQEHLRRDVGLLCNRYAPRSWRDTRNLDDAAVWIARELADAGFEVRSHPYEIDGRTYRNVVAWRKGRDPEAGAIVVGAHYDTVEGSPGADDNASGVAVLLELARTLPDVYTRRTHYLVAFGTEEPPYFGSEQMGSAIFARELAERGTDVVLMASLDMVGYFSDARGSQRFPNPLLRLLYPGRGNFLAIIGDAKSGPGIDRAKRALLATGRLPIHSFRAPASTELVQLSDHASFRAHGFQAVQVTDTAFMRNPHYHLAEDTPDTLDYERMAEVVRALHGLFRE
jgi:Zn-dependent M28 family amino/carboxypeptidase